MTEKEKIHHIVKFHLIRENDYIEATYLESVIYKLRMTMPLKVHISYDYKFITRVREEH